jgi:hypothetical protein
MAQLETVLCPLGRSSVPNQLQAQQSHDRRLSGSLLNDDQGRLPPAAAAPSF